jgi:hypothetical protein
MLMLHVGDVIKQSEVPVHDGFAMGSSIDHFLLVYTSIVHASSAAKKLG